MFDNACLYGMVCLCIYVCVCVCMCEYVFYSIVNAIPNYGGGLLKFKF